MTRIVSGLAGGRRLKVPPAGVRPTGDRAREGLFNSLTTLVDLAVPRLADWCSINVADAQGTYTRVAAKHVDPAKECEVRLE